MNRTQFVTEIAGVARQIADLLDQHPLLGGQPYPLPEVRRQLAEHHATLRAAVQAYPAPLAVTPDGRPDKLGEQLTGLMSYLEHLQVLYHNLDDIPDHMRAKTGRALGHTHMHARRVRLIPR